MIYYSVNKKHYFAKIILLIILSFCGIIFSRIVYSFFWAFKGIIGGYSASTLGGIFSFLCLSPLLDLLEVCINYKDEKKGVTIDDGGITLLKKRLEWCDFDKVVFRKKKNHFSLVNYVTELIFPTLYKPITGAKEALYVYQMNIYKNRKVVQRRIILRPSYLIKDLENFKGEFLKRGIKVT